MGKSSGWFLGPDVWVPLHPRLPWTSAACAPVFLLLRAAFPHPNTPVPLGRFIPSVCFMLPTPQHLHCPAPEESMNPKSFLI